MNLKSRLRAVEKRMPPPPFDMAPAERFAITAVSVVLAMPGIDATHEEAMISYARQMLYRLRFAIEDCKGDPREEIPDFQAQCTALVLFFRLLPAELRSRVAMSDALMGDGSAGIPWAENWIHSVARQSSRLPPDITPETMGTLATIYLDRPQDVDKCIPDNCPACGLRLPRHVNPPMNTWKLLPGRQAFDGQPPPWYDLPEFFTACPHCGAKHHYVDDRKASKQDWQSKAAEEMKTYIGIVEQATKGIPTRSKRHARNRNRAF